MKRFLTSLATFSLVEWIGRHAALAGVLMLLGVGGGAVVANLTTPTIVPMASSYFNMNQSFGNTANALKPNNGTAGALELPSNPANSFAILVEGLVNPNLSDNTDANEYALGNGSGAQGLILSGSSPGQPQFLFQKYTVSGGAEWWNAVSTNTYGASVSVSGTLTNYATGYYPFTTSGGGCARNPTGVWAGGGAGAYVVDPGFLCGYAPTVNPATIPGDGAQQATGAGSISTTCAVVSGQAQVTAHVAIAHGLTPGQTYAMAGFTPSGFNALITAPYTALPGTSGTTLVGTTGASSCPSPATATVEGTALSGTTAVITWPAISTAGPFSAMSGHTGITARLAQHFCGIIGEYGADSAFPGAQFASFVDDNGNPLPGAPALVPWLNQGTANFTGYTLAGAQSLTFTATAISAGNMTTTGSPALAAGQYVFGAGFPTGVTVTGGSGNSWIISNTSISISSNTSLTANTPALVVTAMNSYTITAATYSGTTGYVTFTTSTNPGFTVGSEFTVSGMTPSGYNQTYVAIAGTSGTTLVGNPLSGPVGTPQALANPGTATGFGSMVSVIMPGMYPLGTPDGVSPYGTYGSTGTGGVGSYGLFGSLGTFTFTGSISGTTLTLGSTPSTVLVAGQALTSSTGSGFIATTVTGLLTGSGGSGSTYSVANTQTAASGTITAAGSIGSSGSPVNIFAYTAAYYSAAPSTTPAGGVATIRTQASLGDFMDIIGNSSLTVPGGKSGWGGALGNIAMLYTPGGFPTQSGSAPSTASLASLCKKQTDIQTFAATNGFTVRSLYRLNDPGMWADSGVATFTGSIAGTALTVASTQYGSTSAMASGAVIAGPGITGCPLSCPTISSGSGSSYALSASGGTVASETMTAGAYKPATPIASNSFNGYISGSTLNVTSIGYTGFTGSLYTGFTASISGTTLTVTSPTTGFPVIGVGTTINAAPGAATAIASGTVVTALGTGFGITGTYTVNNSQTVASESMLGGGTLPGPPGDLVVSSSTGLAGGMLVTDGGASLTSPPLLMISCTGTLCGVNSSYYPSVLNDTTMAATLTTLVPGQYLQNASLATPVKIIGYGTLSPCPTTGLPGCGTYPLSSSANGSVGSSGSPVAFTSTSISDGGAPAPGPALTIHDLGPGVTFPVTSYGSGSYGSYSGTGSLNLSGTFDTSVLGGTPSTIQAQVSTSANGPAISGCSACAWTGLSSYATTPFTFTASITTGGAMTVPLGTPQPSVGNAFTGAGYSGTITAATGAGAFTVSPSPGSAVASETMTASRIFSWSGQALGIPAGGPYYVSVRAANGTAYATLPNLIKVGLLFNFWGEGQLGSIFSGLGGTAVSTFNGLWGTIGTGPVLDAGPPVHGNWAPAQTVMIAGDRFGITGASTGLLEGSANFEQGLASAFGWPVGLINGERDGTGTGPQAYGDVTQTQTVGVGNGSTATWCSASTYCSNTSVSGSLYFTGASLTGASLVNATISGSTLTVPAGSGTPTTTGLTQGALQPGLVLNVTGSPALTTCLTGCTTSAYGDPPGGQTWALSSSSGSGLTPTRADLPGGSPWSTYNVQIPGVPLYGPGSGFGLDLVQAGTFNVSVNGTIVCQDSNVFAYNNQGGNCTGAGISSSFVSYLTGDYSITFTTPPAANAVITASWTNIISPDGWVSSINRPQGFDYFGNGSCTSGYISSQFCKAPGGVSANVFAGSNQDAGPMLDSGYALGAPGYTQMISWLYSTKFPNAIPGSSATTPFISAGYWRGSGPIYFFLGASCCQDFSTWLVSQWYHDVATQSTFSGTISGGVLTLSANAVGPMWEGEVVGGTGLQGGIDILSLTSGAWGASGSTYSLGGASGASFTGAMQNAVYYQGAGPAFYAGPMNDDVTQSGSAIAGTTVSGALGYGPHPGMGFAGGRRVGQRWAALIWGGLTNPANASDPTLDRVKADAGGCDTSALAAPCFDVGNTYAASASGAISGSTITFTGGLSAHSRPFVVGQLLSCSGCTAGRFIVAVSAPPTQSTVSGAGQVGNTFTVTASGSLGVSTTKVVTAGCSGTAGVGSNCIDVAIKINTTNGTYGTAAALATCGANNLNGTNTPNFNPPTGVCQDNGIGSLVRNFRIGTQQYIISSSPGLPYDDGIDQLSSGAFSQSSAFTCNIVAAKVVQCVKNAAYTSGVPTGVGEWASGSTFIEYGDSVMGTTRNASLMGYVGGQSFPFTAGSGYTNGTYTISGYQCSPVSGGVIPKMDVSVSGGAIVDVYPSANISALGLGLGAGCAWPVNFTFTGVLSGSGSTTLTVTGTPTGELGVGTTITDAGAHISTPVVITALGSGTGGAGTYTVTNANGAVSSETMTAGAPGGTGASITSSTLGPVEGVGGIATFATDNNLMGVQLYDNSGFSGNPLNPFLTNGQGGYFEPGLPVQPWGEFLAAGVSG